MSKRDFLKDCNNLAVPMTEFTAVWCKQCLQSECSRSAHGTSKFDQRTQSWKERLFTDVSRMDPSDQRYQGIAGQGFELINPEPVTPGGDSAWVDPRDLSKTKVQVAVPSGFTLTAEPPKEAPQVEVPEARVQPSQVSKEPENLPREVLLMNSPDQSGRVLPGAPATNKVAQPKKDPWAVPESVNPDEKIVERGATIRFGQS